MKKRMVRKAGVILLAGALFLSGCGTKQPSAEETVKEEEQKEEAVEKGEPEKEEEDAEEPKEKPKEDETEEESADTEEPKVERPASDEELKEARTRHIYAGILSGIVLMGQMPDGNYADYTYGDMEGNQFAIQDVDGDGREELLIFYTETSMAGMVCYVYDWDEEANQLREELLEFPMLTFYENGFVKAEWSHNQGLGDTLWPFTLYRYDSESDTYQMAGSVDSWEKNYRGEDFEGNPFPEELDTDGDGILYYISEAGDYNMEEPVNQAEYDAWLQSQLGDAKPLEINGQAWSLDCFSNFTPEYLKLLRDQAKASGDFPEKDAGFDFMENEMDMWGLEEKIAADYGISMESQDESEMYVIGTAEGKEICEFMFEDAGIFIYKEKQEGLTVCGLAPGISLEEAVEKLKALGFYMSRENCYITGEGWGNYEVVLVPSNGIVNEISFREYCAFVG